MVLLRLRGLLRVASRTLYCTGHGPRQLKIFCWHDKTWSIVWICITLGLAALMTSTIRFYSFKDIPWTRRQPSLAIVLLAVFCAAIWRWSEIVLFLLASTYAVVGVSLHIVRFARHRLTSRPA